MRALKIIDINILVTFVLVYNAKRKVFILKSEGKKRDNDMSKVMFKMKGGNRNLSANRLFARHRITRSISSVEF